MSRGLSKLQRAIIGLLDGTVPRAVYGRGALTTSELLEELVCRGLVPPERPRKIAMYTIRRACISLLDRGIVTGEYVVHDPCAWTDVLSWRIAKDGVATDRHRDTSGEQIPSPQFEDLVGAAEPHGAAP
jgi:hypothetical protein